MVKAQLATTYKDGLSFQMRKRNFLLLEIINKLLLNRSKNLALRNKLNILNRYQKCYNDISYLCSKDNKVYMLLYMYTYNKNVITDQVSFIE